VKLYLIRHGRTASNAQGRYSDDRLEPLDEIGTLQAGATARALRVLKPDKVYASPYRRALDTAAGFAVEVCDDLRELDLGPWAGLTAAQIAEAWPHEWQAWRSDPRTVDLPGRETLDVLHDRVSRFIGEASAFAGRYGTVAAVTHDAVIRSVVAHTLGVPISIYRRLVVDHGSLTRIDILNAGLRLVQLNDTNHLVRKENEMP
jgi:phosphoserine phosphatase